MSTFLGYFLQFRYDIDIGRISVPAEGEKSISVGPLVRPQFCDRQFYGLPCFWGHFVDDQLPDYLLVL